MTRESFTESLTGMCNLAKASGLPDTEIAAALLFVALAVADRHSKNGCERGIFVKMAEVTYDHVRRALASGPAS